MTRRTFLKSLGVASAGVAAGLSMLPKAKETPLWVTAGYETKALYRDNLRYDGFKFYIDPNPKRFFLIDGEWRRAEWA